MRINQRDIPLVLLALAIGLVNGGCPTAVPRATVVEKSRSYSGTYNKVWGTTVMAPQSEDITSMLWIRTQASLAASKTVRLLRVTC